MINTWKLFYLGYNIKLINNKQEKINLKYQNDKYGFIKINVPENGIVKINYSGTLSYRVAIWVRNVVILIGIFLFLVRMRKNKNRMES